MTILGMFGVILLVEAMLIFFKCCSVHFSLPKTWSKGSKWDEIARANDFMTLVFLGLGFVGFLIVVSEFGNFK